MKKIRLNKYEQEIEDNILEYKSVSSAERKKINKIIDKAREKKSISLRLNAHDLDMLKLKAQREGIPYQTLISSVLHKFVTGRYVDENDFTHAMQLCEPLAGYEKSK